MSKRRLARRIAQTGGAIGGGFFVRLVWVRRHAPADDAVSIELCIRIFGAQSGKQSGQQLLRSHVKIDAASFRLKLDGDIGVAQSKQKSSPGGSVVRACRGYPISG